MKINEQINQNVKTFKEEKNKNDVDDVEQQSNVNLNNYVFSEILGNYNNQPWGGLSRRTTTIENIIGLKKLVYFFTLILVGIFFVLSQGITLRMIREKQRAYALLIKLGYRINQVNFYLTVNFFLKTFKSSVLTVISAYTISFLFYNFIVNKLFVFPLVSFNFFLLGSVWLGIQFLLTLAYLLALTFRKRTKNHYF
jgi:ABC-type antimicrobial peptide transport system permease subunit